jgi:hypothetical protein
MGPEGSDEVSYRGHVMSREVRGGLYVSDGVRRGKMRAPMGVI